MGCSVSCNSKTQVCPDEPVKKSEIAKLFIVHPSTNLIGLKKIDSTNNESLDISASRPLKVQEKQMKSTDSLSIKEEDSKSHNNDSPFSNLRKQFTDKDKINSLQIMKIYSDNIEKVNNIIADTNSSDENLVTKLDENKLIINKMSNVSTKTIKTIKTVKSCRSSEKIIPKTPKSKDS